MTTYKIVRHFEDPTIASYTVYENLTADQAADHIMSLESASHTCTSIAGKRRFANFGPWWDEMETQND